MSLNQLSAKILHHCVTKCLTYDPDLQEKCLPLEGQHIAIELTDIQQTFIFSIRQQQLFITSNDSITPNNSTTSDNPNKSNDSVQSNSPASENNTNSKNNAASKNNPNISEIDVVLKGRSTHFFSMATQKNSKETVLTGNIHIEGDVACAQAFQSFWEQLSIDWEEWISEYTGDSVSYQIGELFRFTRKKLHYLFDSAQHNFAEYLQEEYRLSPTPEEVNQFYDNIDDIKSDVERLSIKIQSLLTT